MKALELKPIRQEVKWRTASTQYSLGGQSVGEEEDKQRVEEVEGVQQNPFTR